RSNRASLSVIPTAVPRRVPQARSVCLGLGFGCPRFDFLPGSWVCAPGTECVSGSWVWVPQVRFSTWVLGLPFPALSSRSRKAGPDFLLHAGAPGTECVSGSWVWVPQVRFSTWVLGLSFPALSSRSRKAGPDFL